MSEELQNGDAPQENQAAAAENQNPVSQAAGSELAPGTEGQQEQNSQVDEAAEAAAKAQAANQEVINKKHFQAKQAERERDEALAKIAKFEQDQREAEAARVGEIPPLPEEFDDNFQEKLAAREQAITQKAQFDAQQAIFQQQQQFNQQQVEQQQAAEVQQKSIAYNARATELGIGAAELQAAGNAVISYGLSNDLAMHILADTDGPLITKHLAANPGEAITLANMSVYDQGAYLQAIKVKTEALKPKLSNTPAPPDQLAGSGAQADLNKFPNSKGATFSTG